MEPIVQIYLVVTGDARGDSRMHDCALGKFQKVMYSSKEGGQVCGSALGKFQKGNVIALTISNFSIMGLQRHYQYHITLLIR